MREAIVGQNSSFPGLTLLSQTTVLREGSRDKTKTIFGDLLVFAIPALQFLEIEIVGRLFASDLILLGSFLFLLLPQGRQLTAPLPRIFLTLGLVWLLGQVVTDLICYTPFEDYVRGWAKIVFFLTNFMALYLLLHNNRRRIVLYAAGMVVGGVLDFYLAPNLFAEAYPWKFGVGDPVTLLLILCATSLTNRTLLLSPAGIGLAILLNFAAGVYGLLLSVGIYKGDSWKFTLIGPIVLLFMLAVQSGFVHRTRLLPAAVIGFAALLNLYMGFRSLAGICFLTATYIFLQKGHPKEDGLSLSARQWVIRGLVGLSAGFVALKGYEYAATTGLLGEEARQKYEWQAAGELGVLLGGRSEILVSARAIMDSPIIGHGSWAKDRRYADMLTEQKRELGYVVTGERDEALIPAHSHLFGAWVEAGFLGGIFWLWVLLLIFRALSALYQLRDPLTPLIASEGFRIIWDVLFSPFGAEERFLTPYRVILLMFVLEMLNAARIRMRYPSG